MDQEGPYGLARLGGELATGTWTGPGLSGEGGEDSVCVGGDGAVEQRESAARPFPLRGYRFIPVDSPQVNAVGMPGGFVLVTTGALQAVQSEDEPAAILAHEVAHVQSGDVLWPAAGLPRALPS